MGGFEAPVWDRLRTRLGEETQEQRMRMNAWPQEQALKEGWCIIDRGHCLEIQKDDDQNEFPTDGMARAYVMEQADEGSDYHVKALIYISQENMERVRNGVECAGDGLIFLWKRTWLNEAVVEKTVTKARACYDPAAGPYDDAVSESVWSNQDLVYLWESAAVPEVTYDTGAFKFAKMEVKEHEGYPVACVCECGNTFPIDPATEENLKAVLIEGRRVNVARCTKCGALAHQPRKI